MRDFMIILLALVAVGGWVYYTAYSHTVQLRYECGIEVPLHEAFLLDTEHCPGGSGS